MNPTQTFQEFMTTNVPTIPIGSFVLNLLLAALYCYVLSVVYVRFGRSLSNRTSLARNFVMVGMTTMVIISIVKSSLALSLGLVGALSIVRFRTAVKEPEELAYLFVTICIGLGLGAGQVLVTTLGLGAIVACLCLKSLFRPRLERSNLFVVVSSRGSDKLSLTQTTEALREHCSELSLKRYDETPDSVEASYRVSFDDYHRLERVKDTLRERGDAVSVSFVDNEELV